MSGATQPIPNLNSNQEGDAKEEESFFEQLQPHVARLFQASVDVKQKTIFPVIGYTGSGKSTLINYMLGYTIVPDFNALGHRVAILDPVPRTKYSVIGQNHLVSETLYPDCFQVDRTPFFLCDCSGLGENRGKVADFCSLVGTQLMLGSVARIPGLIIVIDSSSLQAGRGEIVQKVIFALSEIAERPADLAPALTFVATKMEPHYRELHLLNYFKSIITGLKDGTLHFPEVSAHSNKKEAHRIVSMDSVLTLLQGVVAAAQDEQNPVNIVVGNIFDKGIAREKLLERLSFLNSANLVSKATFKSDGYASAGSGLSSIMTQIVADGTSLLLRRRRALEQKDITEREIVQKTADYAQSEQRLQFLSQGSGVLTAEEVKKIKESGKEEKIKIMKELQELEQRVHAENEKIKDWERQRDEIDTEELRQVYDKLVEEVRAAVFGAFGSTRHIFRFNNPQVPIRQYTRKPEGPPVSGIGFVNETVSALLQGSYHAEYYSGRGQNAYASVTLSAYSRDVPENKEQIKLLQEKILQAKIVLGQAEIAQKYAMENFKACELQLANNLKYDRSEQIGRVQDESLRLSEAIERLKLKIKGYIADITLVEGQLFSMRPLLILTKQLIECLRFNASIYRDFLEEMHQSGFSEGFFGVRSPQAHQAGPNEEKGDVVPVNMPRSALTLANLLQDNSDRFIRVDRPSRRVFSIIFNAISEDLISSLREDFVADLRQLGLEMDRDYIIMVRSGGLSIELQVCSEMALRSMASALEELSKAYVSNQQAMRAFFFSYDDPQQQASASNEQSSDKMDSVVCQLQ